MVKKLDSEIDALKRKISRTKKHLAFNTKATDPVLVIAIISGFISGMLIAINRFLELHGPAVTLRGYFIGWFLLWLIGFFFSAIFTTIALSVLSETRRYLQKRLRELNRNLRIAEIRKDRQLRYQTTIVYVIPSLR